MALEGGWGWVVVGAAFVINALTLGAIRCLNVYLLPIKYEFHTTHAGVTLISSLMILGIAFSGLLSIPLTKKLGNRGAIFTSASVASFSIFLSQYAKVLPLFVVTFGFLVGVGSGLSFLVTAVVIGNYFEKRRSLATNIASIGASVGTLIISPMATYLIEEYTLRGYLLIYSAISLHILVAAALMRPAPKNREEVKEEVVVVNEEAVSEDQGLTPEKSKGVNVVVKDKLFWLFSVATAIFFAGVSINILFLLPFAEHDINIPTLKAPFIVSSQASMEIISRIIYGFLGDFKRIDRTYLLAASYFGQFTCSVFVPFTTTFNQLLAVRLIMGLFEGSNGGLAIIIFADIVGLKHYSTAFGIGLCIKGLIGLILPIVAGAAVDATGKESTALWISTLVMFIGSITTLLAARLLQLRRKNVKRRQEVLTVSNNQQ